MAAAAASAPAPDAAASPAAPAVLAPALAAASRFLSASLCTCHQTLHARHTSDQSITSACTRHGMQNTASTFALNFISSVRDSFFTLRAASLRLLKRAHTRCCKRCAVNVRHQLQPSFPRAPISPHSTTHQPSVNQCTHAPPPPLVVICQLIVLKQLLPRPLKRFLKEPENCLLPFAFRVLRRGFKLQGVVQTSYNLNVCPKMNPEPSTFNRARSPAACAAEI